MTSFGSSRQEDTYEQIYERYKGSGFEFIYAKKRLGKSKPIFRKEVAKISPAKRNHDDTPLFVRCRDCNVYMDFDSGPNGILDGRWICPSCGAKVKEIAVYNKLAKENDDFSKNISDEKPEFCYICGGPWPDCETSCKLFDD